MAAPKGRPRTPSDSGPEGQRDLDPIEMADAQSGARIERLDVSVFDIPTEGPESDGTLEWSKTTLVVVEASAGGRCGTGYTYADGGTAKVIEEALRPVVVGTDAMGVTANWRSMVRSIRNL